MNNNSIRYPKLRYSNVIFIFPLTGTSSLFPFICNIFKFSVDKLKFLIRISTKK